MTLREFVDGGAHVCPDGETRAGAYGDCPVCNQDGYLARSVESSNKVVPLELPAGAIQLLYDVLGHFPHDPGSWSTDARARCSIALRDALDS